MNGGRQQCGFLLPQPPLLQACEAPSPHPRQLQPRREARQHRCRPSRRRRGLPGSDASEEGADCVGRLSPSVVAPDPKEKTADHSLNTHGSLENLPPCISRSFPFPLELLLFTYLPQFALNLLQPLSVAPKLLFLYHAFLSLFEGRCNRYLLIRVTTYTVVAGFAARCPTCLAKGTRHVKAAGQRIGKPMGLTVAATTVASHRRPNRKEAVGIRISIGA